MDKIGNFYIIKNLMYTYYTDVRVYRINLLHIDVSEGGFHER